MAYDAPTPNIGLELPTLGTNQRWDSAKVKSWFETIDEAFGEDRADIASLQNDVTSWADYNPAPTNLVIGNGSIIAKWRRRGQMVDVFVALQFGSTTLIGGGPVISLPPATPAPWLTGVSLPVTPVVGQGQLEDVSEGASGRWDAEILFGSGGLRIGYRETSTNKVRWAAASNTLPFLWSNVVGNQDRLSFMASYPTA